VGGEKQSRLDGLNEGEGSKKTKQGQTEPTTGSKAEKGDSGLSNVQIQSETGGVGQAEQRRRGGVMLGGQRGKEGDGKFATYHENCFRGWRGTEQGGLDPWYKRSKKRGAVRARIPEKWGVGRVSKSGFSAKQESDTQTDESPIGRSACLRDPKWRE